MLPWPNVLLSCPHCQTTHLMRTISSGNTIGAKHWTDGKFEAPMMRLPPVITSCWGCRKFFWTEEAERIGEEKPFRRKRWFERRVEKPPTIEHWVEELNAESCKKALDEEIARTGNGSPRAMVLSVMYWRKLNDPVRETGKSDDVHQSKLRENFGTFVRNLENMVECTIMRAEYLRELGRFDECIAVLSEGDFEDASWAVDVIAGLARERRREVAVMRK